MQWWSSAEQGHAADSYQHHRRDHGHDQRWQQQEQEPRYSYHGHSQQQQQQQQQHGFDGMEQPHGHRGSNGHRDSQDYFDYS